MTLRKNCNFIFCQRITKSNKYHSKQFITLLNSSTLYRRNYRRFLEMWPQSSLSAYIAIQGVHTYCIQTQKVFNLIIFLKQLFNVYNNSIRERSSSVTAHVSKCTVSSKNKSSDFVVINILRVPYGEKISHIGHIEICLY